MTVAAEPALGPGQSARQGLTRRAVVSSMVAAGPSFAGLSLLGLPGPVAAGAQLEEPMIDAVRTALSSAISNQAPPIPEFFDTESRLAYLRWLGGMSDRLQKKNV